MNFCKACLQRHDRNSLFAGHKTTEKAMTVQPNYTCKIHASELAKFLCRKCQMVACALCVINSHDGHDVIELEHVLDENKDMLADLQRLLTTKMDRSVN